MKAPGAVPATKRSTAMSICPSVARLTLSSCLQPQQNDRARADADQSAAPANLGAAGPVLTALDGESGPGPAQRLSAPAATFLNGGTRDILIW